jgi:HSP20 family molecular chaperone IbpA
MSKALSSYEAQQLINSFFGTDDDKFMLMSNEGPYPPYNAWQDGDGNCILEMAVSGFGKEDLKIEFDGTTLTIKGDKQEKFKDPGMSDLLNSSSPSRWIHRGLAKRDFIRRFRIRGTCELDEARLRQGLLTIVIKDKTKKVDVKIVEID